MIVVTAQRGGAFRETLAIAKAYVEARNQHGESELLDEIVSAKPKIQLLEQKATPEELDDYKRFLLNVADRSPTLTGKADRDVNSGEEATRLYEDLTGAVRD